MKIIEFNDYFITCDLVYGFYREYSKTIQRMFQSQGQSGIFVQLYDKYILISSTYWYVWCSHQHIAVKR